MNAKHRSLVFAITLAVGCNDKNNVSATQDLSANHFDATTDGEQNQDAGGSSDLAAPARCSGAVPSQFTPGAAPTAFAGIALPTGFTIEQIATIANARELAALPNGDLLVATIGTSIYLVPNAEGSAAAGAPVVFATINDSPTQGITFAPALCTAYVATQHGVYSLPYTDGALTATTTKIADVRTGIVAPNSDGDVHTTSSIAYANQQLYVGVGSSCNACTEIDPTRGTIQVMQPDGTQQATRATRMRNAIALAENPATHTLWAGGAGQDDLSLGHPYEYFDAITVHAGVADYGWPACEENHTAYVTGADCSATIAPVLEFPAYSTLIGAVFYPATQTGAYQFPANYRGLFVTGHGSWHTTSSTYYTPPRVAFVAMNGDAPVTAVNWSNPAVQWTEFAGGYQLADGMTRIGRPTGIALGVQGSLFIGDDQNGAVYRIRYTH